MEAYILDWLNLLVRWVHAITGIAWIGASFYFIWLDNHLLSPKDSDDDAKGVGGEVWSVHGGGFYHAQKYKVAPAELPSPLHWFKWEAYSTWISGMFLLVLVYWYSADVYLVDPSVRELSAGAAVGIAAAFIAGGWFVYDLLCKSPLANNEKLFSGVLLLLVAALAWGLCQLFGGRGAYIHFGVVLGTIMVANVFCVIIPGQRQMVEAAARGEAPDPAPGIRAKQRSVHNTYFTLPVLFTMTSNHFAMTYGHEYNWLILVGISLAGALIRVYFVARHKGNASLVPMVVERGDCAAEQRRNARLCRVRRCARRRARALYELPCDQPHASGIPGRTGRGRTGDRRADSRRGAANTPANRRDARHADRQSDKHYRRGARRHRRLVSGARTMSNCR